MKTRFETTNRTYVIAEVGINHNGDLSEAKNLIRAAVEAGADSVKTQLRHLPSIYVEEVLKDSLKAEQGTQYLLDVLKKSELGFEQIKELADFSQKNFPEIDFFVTPFDPTSAAFLNEIGMNLFKIGSPDFTNLPLLRTVADFKKPMIISTGMSEEPEIQQVYDFLKSINADFSFLHCHSAYPAPLDTLNVNFIDEMKKRFNVKIGYSGHEKGWLPTLAAVSKGAQIVERHITQDQDSWGPDHRASLTPSEFKKMVEDIRSVEKILGQHKRILSQGEKNNRLGLAKSLVASRDLPVGTKLDFPDLIAKTPAKGASPLQLMEFIGKELTVNLKKDDYISTRHISEANSNKESYDIPKKWGIVGRLNDFRDFLDLKPELIEIHMTWRDLAEHKATNEVFQQDLVVHAPEYYQDKLIDFTTNDKKVVDYSLEMLQRTIDIARELNPQFKGQTDSRGPRVVVHPGGHFSYEAQSNKDDQYANLKKNLKLVNSEGVRLLVENMPPRPWYFGGQWYNTIFLDAKEIAQFSTEMGWPICFDTSHAVLYCQYAGIPFSKFTKEIVDHAGYFHISDGRGSTEEGLQIGDGVIDFEEFFRMISNKNLGFIPEIWQGHLNKGEGFKIALRKIEKILKGVSSDAHCTADHQHDHAHQDKKIVKA